MRRGTRRRRCRCGADGMARDEKITQPLMTRKGAKFEGTVISCGTEVGRASCIRNIYEMSIECLWNIYEMSMKYLWNIYEISVNTYEGQIFINIYECLLRPCTKHSWSIHKVPMKHPWSTHEASMKHPWSTHEASMKGHNVPSRYQLYIQISMNTIEYLWMSTHICKYPKISLRPCATACKYLRISMNIYKYL